MSRPEATAGEAARVGEELRDARLSMGVSLEETAERLRINRRYLAALEEGRVRDLPGVAYATGFIRTYAMAMGLDADDMVRRFREAAGAARPKGDLVFPEPVPERGVPGGALVLVGAVLAIAAYAAWYNWSGSSSRTVDAVPALPSRLEPAAEQSRTAARDAASANTQAAPVVPPATPPAATPTPGGAVASGPVAAAPGAVVSPGARPAVPGAPQGAANAPAAPAPPAPAPAGAAPLGDQPRIVLRASGETWVQVRDSRGGEVVFNRVMRAGDTYDVPNRPGLLLTTGKAQELAVVVDGQASPALEGMQAVRRDIALDPARLKAPAAPR